MASLLGNRLFMAIIFALLVAGSPYFNPKYEVDVTSKNCVIANFTCIPYVTL